MEHYLTPDLCDAYPELVQVLEPMFSNFGGRDSFGGEIVTIKCFEDNSLVKEQAELNGKGKVLVVDGGGSLRRALLGDMIAAKAAQNGWEGLPYGAPHPRRPRPRKPMVHTTEIPDIGTSSLLG